jgi:hypothetical protein
MKARTWHIYALFDHRSPGRIRYVGVTHNRPKARLRDHVRKAEIGKCLYHSSTAEIRWIAWHKEQGHDLTNHTDGGEGSPGVIVSAEARKKMAAAKLGKPRSAESIAKAKATMGTAEYRTRHSLVHRGHKPTSATLIKMSLALKGKGQTPEHVSKRAEANRGKKRSAEVRERFSAIKRGHKQSPETIAKRVASLTGRKRSADSRAKMSESAKSRVRKKAVGVVHTDEEIARVRALLDQETDTR